MLNRIIKRLTSYFYKNGIIEKKDIEVYEYGLEVLLTSVFEVLAIIIISIILGQFWVSVLFLLSFCLLRTFAGGFHAKTNFRCFLTLLFVYAVFLALLNYAGSPVIGWFPIVSAIVSDILVVAFAPVDSENRRLTAQETIKYRKISRNVVTVETLIVLSFLFAIKNKYILFSVSYGQLAAALSLLAVKIKCIIRGRKIEIAQNQNS
jgi:accessory gene regulator B